MAILKDNNKIITNAAGEILTKSDSAVDLRSTYGVTKNVSNEVSKGKLYNNPSVVYRAPLGREPIEDGDGFEIDETWLNLQHQPAHDFYNFTNYSFEVWIKPTILDGNIRAVFGNFTNAADTSSYHLTFDANDNLIFGTFDVGARSLLYTNTATMLNIWNHVLITKEGTNMYLYINGYYRHNLNNLTPKVNTSKERLMIGAAWTYISTPFRNFNDGNIYSLRLYPDYLVHKYNSEPLNTEAFKIPVMK